MLSKWNGRPLNGAFGALVENANPKQLADPVFCAEAYQLWSAYNGLLIVRGPDLAFLTPESLLHWGETFGTVDWKMESGRDFCRVGNLPIMRIGNTVDHRGTSNAIFSDESLIKTAEDVRYNPATRVAYRRHFQAASTHRLRLSLPTGSQLRRCHFICRHVQRIRNA